MNTFGSGRAGRAIVISGWASSTALQVGRAAPLSTDHEEVSGQLLHPFDHVVGLLRR